MATIMTDKISCQTIFLDAKMICVGPSEPPIMPTVGALGEYPQRNIVRNSEKYRFIIIISFI